MLFTGRLTRDAEVRKVKGGKNVTEFTVALNERYRNRQGDKMEKTAFVKCSYWIGSAVADYLKKGNVVEISGWVTAEGWVSRDGELMADLLCNVSVIKLFGGPAATSK